MPKFYFTYGLDDTQPFKGGWTEIIAPDVNTACAVFRIFHPDRPGWEGILNCSSVYAEDRFKKTEMSGPDGNFGKFCWEHIELSRTLTGG